jgi:hypothetical protein
MNTLEQIKLSDVFMSVRKPKYILGTTYTLSLAFFESVLLQYIDRSNLVSCLIVCDSIGYERALAEGAALQGAAQDYQVARAPVADCFHPKVWIIIGGEESVLLAGSGNLTQAGFVNNAELFDALRISAETPVSPELLDSMRSFVGGLAQMWPNEDSKHLLCTETLGRIGEALSTLPTSTAPEDEVRFLHSFRGSLLDQLPETPNSQEIYIASPYFGGSLDGVNLLARKYSTAKLIIFPGVHEGRATDIPLSALSASYERAQVAPLAIPSKRESQFAHLKLYGVATSEEEAWLYCTSANCTKAAWSAWRGALALLEEEGAPELADIAALFSLARDVFDGTLARMPKSPLAGKGDASKQQEEEKPVAVWPPQPDFRNLQRNIGSNAVGRLQWFQRIFQTFLDDDEKAEDGAHQSQDAEGADDESGENDAAGKRREEEAKRTLTVAQRIWAQAIKDYDRL